MDFPDIFNTLNNSELTPESFISFVNEADYFIHEDASHRFLKGDIITKSNQYMLSIRSEEYNPNLYFFEIRGAYKNRLSFKKGIGRKFARAIQKFKKQETQRLLNQCCEIVSQSIPNFVSKFDFASSKTPFTQTPETQYTFSFKKDNMRLRLVSNEEARDSGFEITINGKTKGIKELRNYSHQIVTGNTDKLCSLVLMLIEFYNHYELELKLCRNPKEKRALLDKVQTPLLNKAKEKIEELNAKYNRSGI